MADRMHKPALIPADLFVLLKSQDDDLGAAQIRALTNKGDLLLAIETMVYRRGFDPSFASRNVELLRAIFSAVASFTLAPHSLRGHQLNPSGTD
jgi:hypothetical protein